MQTVVSDVHRRRRVRRHVTDRLIGHRASERFKHVVLRGRRGARWRNVAHPFLFELRLPQTHLNTRIEGVGYLRWTQVKVFSECESGIAIRRRTYSGHSAVCQVAAEFQDAWFWKKCCRITHMGTEQKNQGKDTKDRLLSCPRFRHNSTHD